jgi:hypothetical protein
MSKPERSRARNSQDKPEKQKEFLYISRKSPRFADHTSKLSLQETGKISKLNARKISMAFLSKAQSSTESKLTLNKDFLFSLKTATARNRISRTKSKDRESLSGLLKCYMVDARSTKRKLLSHRLTHKSPSNRSERKFLSHMDRLRLFQALSNQPLPFLDIHRRFGISKQTINGFIKRGLVEERWGQKNIGVRFILTRKGRSYFKQLKAAAHLDPQKQKSIFIRLKQKICS